MIIVKFTIVQEGDQFKVRCDGHDQNRCTADEAEFCAKFVAHVNAFNSVYKPGKGSIRMRAKQMGRRKTK